MSTGGIHQNSDISTQQICDFTSKSVNRKYTTEQVALVWHEVGNVIKSQLLQRKAVRLTSFGTFSLSKGYPAFSLSSDMMNQFKLTYAAPSSLDNIPTAALNFAQVSANVNQPRDVVEKIYTKFITALGRMIFEGRTILLTINHVGEIDISNYQVTCEFIPDFYNLFHLPDNEKAKTVPEYRNVAKKTSTLLTTQQQYLANTEKRMNENIPTTQTGLLIGGESNAGFGKRGSGPPRSASASRGRNPITGEEYGSNRPQSTGRAGAGGRNPGNFRRPGSAGSNLSQGSVSTNSLLHSPRSQYSNDRPFQRNPPPRGSSQGQRPTQPRSAAGIATNNGGRSNPEDARAVAAKALTSNDIIDKVRQKITERGGSTGIRSITKLLSIMDENGDKKLSKDELKYGLRDYGINLTPVELDQVFYYFDLDHNGFIDVTEFLVGLKGDLNPRRKQLVQKAFNLLDKDQSGTISVDEILAAYDLSWHPDVRAGRMTVKEAAKEFMKQWERGATNLDDGVTFEEFEDYYKEISASIDDDDYFELMMRNAWRMAGGEGAAANTANRRVLVTNKDGSQAVRTIENELGMNAKDKDDIRRRLGGGDDIGQIDLYGGYDDRQAAKRGRPQLSQQRQPPPPQQRPGNPAPNQGRSGNSNSKPRSNTGGANNGRREAWSDFPSGGPPRADQDLPPDYDRGSSRRGGGGGGAAGGSNNGYSNNRPGSATTGVYDLLKKIFYTPPVNLEQLCNKLQVSTVTTSPRMPQGAFFTRIQQLDPTLTKEQLSQIWKILDEKKIGILDVNDFFNFLQTRYGKDKTSRKDMGVIERVIKKILERCGEHAGIKGLSRTLAIMDTSGDKKLSKEEFKYGMQEYGVELNIRELDEVFNYFDRNRLGYIDLDELLIGIKGDLNERRKKFVQLAFNILDTDGSGDITIDEMMAKYDFTHNPDVVSGKKTIKEAAREFMQHWEKPGHETISFEEFEDYYKGISASIDNDDYFELMMRNAWRMAGGEGAAANTANRRVLVTNKDGSQAVRTIENELGMNAKDKDDIRRRLGGGDDIGQIDLYGGYDDKSNSRYNANRAKARTTQLDNRFKNEGNNSQRVQNRAGTPVNNRRGSSSGGGNDPRRGQNNNNRTAPAALITAYDKNQAASKLAAAFRGRQARKQFAHEKRKQEAQKQQQMQEDEENNRPRRRDILRPKGKSYIGF